VHVDAAPVLQLVIHVRVVGQVTRVMNLWWETLAKRKKTVLTVSVRKISEARKKTCTRSKRK
jgi:hypothetical protein